MPEYEPILLPAGLMGGRLEGVEFPDLMWSLCNHRVTGVLEITQGAVTRKLYLREGRIVFACSGDPNDRLGETLLRKGKISLDELERALRSLRTGKRLGRLLVETGALTDEELITAVMSQVRSIVLDVLGWNVGEYRFHSGDLPTDEVITLDVPTAELLMQGIRGIDSFRRVRYSVGPPHSMFALASGWKELRRGVRLTENEELVLERLGHGTASVEDLCEELTLSNFEVYRTVWAFRTLGLVDERDRDASGDPRAPRVGELQSESFPEILVAKSREGATGVLYASRRNVERSFHLDRGCCVFATSSLPDDGLVSFLLRKGVISLRDREETRKRLLSNRRVGTILRDMGVLDAEDLNRMVREQLSEIIYDTFQWDHGEFVFVPGPLPSEELIHLDIGLARLVTEGIRRIDSWTRVIQGCGGVDHPLALHPDSSSVLDAMEAGPDVKEIAKLLEEPHSPRRACRELPGGDYRICQTLWTLRLLGAAETANIDYQEMIPEDLPAPMHADAAALAVGRELADDVNASLSELPDTADLISRHAVDSESMLANSMNAEPRRMVPKPRPSAAVRDSASASGTQAGEVPGIDDDGPELLDLEDLEPDPAQAPSSAASAEPAAGAASAEPLVELQLDADGAASEVPVDEPPKDAQDRVIEKFNEMHRIVYAAVRAEVGAGAVNFVRSCCGQAKGAPGLLHGVALEQDGSWNAKELKQAIVELRIEDPWGAYEQLLDREFVLLAPHLGQQRAEKLKERIWAIKRAGSA